MSKHLPKFPDLDPSQRGIFGRIIETVAQMRRDATTRRPALEEERKRNLAAARVQDIEREIKADRQAAQARAAQQQRFLNAESVVGLQQFRRPSDSSESR